MSGSTCFVMFSPGTGYRFRLASVTVLCNPAKYRSAAMFQYSFWYCSMSLAVITGKLKSAFQYSFWYCSMCDKLHKDTSDESFNTASGTVLFIFMSSDCCRWHSRYSFCYCSIQFLLFPESHCQSFNTASVTVLSVSERTDARSAYVSIQLLLLFYQTWE